MGLPAPEDLKRRFARLISVITYAPVLSIPIFLVINYFSKEESAFLSISLISIAFAAILPLSIVFLWISLRKESDMDIPKREDRSYPLIIVVMSYLIGTLVLIAFQAPLITVGLMFCYFSNTLVIFFINLRWKISIHSMGVAGPTVALIFSFGYLGAISGLLIPLVMWSRVHLKKHTVSQVIAGALLGLILTTVQLNLLLS